MRQPNYLDYKHFVNIIFNPNKIGLRYHPKWFSWFSFLAQLAVEIMQFLLFGWWPFNHMTKISNQDYASNSHAIFLNSRCTPNPFSILVQHSISGIIQLHFLIYLTLARNKLWKCMTNFSSLVVQVVWCNNKSTDLNIICENVT